MIPFGLICVLALPSSETIRATPKRVSADSWRKVAAAQVPQTESFRVLDRTGATRPEVVLTVRLEGRSVPLILRPRDESDPAQVVEELWVDVNGDGFEAETELLTLEVRDESNPFVHVSLAGLGLPFELTIFEHLGEFRLTVVTHYHFEAQIEVDGRPTRLFFLDMNLDGRVSDGDQWLALDEDMLAAANLPAMLFNSNLSSEPWYFGERTLLPTAFGPDGSVELSLAPQEVPRNEFLAKRAARVQRTYFEGYDEDRDSFLEAYDIDPERQVAIDPPDWYYAWDLAEALSVADKEGRPLYVEFGTDGCPWCKRYDWLNYRDLAVAERLRRFTLVKINRDLDPNQTAIGLGLDGVPCHVLFDAEGEAVHSSTGWIPPQAYVEELDRTWAAWRKSRE